MFWYVFYNFSCQIPLLIYIKDTVKKILLTIVCQYFLPYKVRRCCLSFKKYKQWWHILKQYQSIIFVLKKNSINEIICVYPTKGYQKYVFLNLTDTIKCVLLCSCTGLLINIKFFELCSLSCIKSDISLYEPWITSIYSRRVYCTSTLQVDSDWLI